MRNFKRTRQLYGLQALYPQKLQQIDDVELIFQSVKYGKTIQEKQVKVENSDFNVSPDDQFREIQRRKRSEHYELVRNANKDEQLRQSNIIRKKADILQYEKEKLDKLMNVIQQKIRKDLDISYSTMRDMNKIKTKYTIQ